MNPSTKVEKAIGPEEQAILANIGALLQELQGGGAAAPAAEPDGDEGLSAPGVSKGSEQGTTPAEPQSVMQPGAAPKQQGMAPWQEGDDVQKAMKIIAKALMASNTDGPEAQEKGDKRLEETSPENDENINEVAKALAKALGLKPAGLVAKSMGSIQQPAQDLAAVLSPLMTVIKSMDARIQQQGQVIAEMLEGLGVAGSVTEPAAPSAVNKSMAGGINAATLEEVVTAVAKGLGVVNVQGSANLPPVAKGFEGQRFGEDIKGFSEGAATAFGWGKPVQQ